MKPKIKKIIGIILQAPLVLVVLISFFISIYAAYNRMLGVTYGASIISGITIVLYFIGVFFVIKSKK